MPKYVEGFSQFDHITVGNGEPWKFGGELPRLSKEGSASTCPFDRDVIEAERLTAIRKQTDLKSGNKNTLEK